MVRSTTPCSSNTIPSSRPFRRPVIPVAGTFQHHSFFASVSPQRAVTVEPGHLPTPFQDARRQKRDADLPTPFLCCCRFESVRIVVSLPTPFLCCCRFEIGFGPLGSDESSLPTPFLCCCRFERHCSAPDPAVVGFQHHSCTVAVSRSPLSASRPCACSSNTIPYSRPFRRTHARRLLPTPFFRRRAVNAVKAAQSFQHHSFVVAASRGPTAPIASPASNTIPTSLPFRVGLFASPERYPASNTIPSFAATPQFGARALPLFAHAFFFLARRAFSFSRRRTSRSRSRIRAFA